MAVPAVRRRWLSSGVDHRLVRLTVGVGSVALLVWALSLFLPRNAFIHQGSYLTMMLLMVSFAAMLTVWPKRVLVPLAAVQFGYFGFVWIAWYYFDGVTHHVSPEAIALMLLALAGVAVLLWRLIRRRSGTVSDEASAEAVNVAPPATSHPKRRLERVTPAAPA
jgi:lysylphosphatidylglycerol synthetase-like protein (DUF2156 family)